MNAALCSVFFLSGVSGLLFETLWFQRAGLALGNTVWASSLVLAAFMGGLAIGNGVTGRVGHRIRRPLFTYAVIEVVVGATGLALVFGLPGLTEALAPLLGPLQGDPWALNAVRVGVGFALLLVPAAAMGATLPLLVATLYRRDPRFGAVLGRLYGWNTWGAVVGALAGEVFLIGWVGIPGAAGIAALGNAVAAVVAFDLSRRFEAGNAPCPSDAAPRTLTPRARRLLAAAFLSGGAMLALEVVWFRFLLLFASGTGLAFAVMLAVVLAGIAAGGLIGSRVLAWHRDAHRHAATLALAGGVACVATYAGFGTVPRSFGGAAHTAWQTLELAAPLMLPSSVLSGVLFTFLGEGVQREAPSAARSAGFVTLSNTLGAMVGSLLAGFVLLPFLGMELSLGLLAATHAGTAGLALSARPTLRRVTVPLAVATVALIASLVSFPAGFLEERYVRKITARFPQWEPVETRETLTETLIYLRRDLFGEPYAWRLLTNGHSMSSTATRDQRYMTLFVTWPMAVNPDAKDALLISYGVGITAAALVETTGLERIDVVDVSAEIMESNRILHRDAAGRVSGYPLDDPRVHVHVEDGRHFLQTTGRRFDLITGEPPPPKLAGIVSLYTREYFSLVRERLTERGITTYWLPVTGLLPSDAKAITRAFCDVFEACSLWSGAGLDWVLVGTKTPLAPVSPAALARPWQDARAAPRLRALGFERPEQLGALFLADAEQLSAWIGDTPPLDDDHPKRLSSEIPRPQPAFRAFMDTDAARARFRESRFIASWWPEALRAPALAAFETQKWIDRALFREQGDFGTALPGLHRTLTETPLETLPLWIAGSDAAAVDAARRASAAGRHGLGIDFHLAVSALAERDYARAAKRFGKARARPLAADRREILFYEIYALCLAERLEEARELADRAGIESGRREEDTRFADFLRSHFAWTEW